METFNFPYHTPSWDYPKGTAVKFGRGYTFSVKPQGPLQRTFKLNFKGGMRWFVNLDGTINATTQPTMNMKRLVDFYEAHLTWKTFVYPHPVFGNVLVKFDPDSPFNVPEPLSGGSGQTESFTLQLIEQPQ
jgi:hypothetical protein